MIKPFSALLIISLFCAGNLVAQQNGSIAVDPDDIFTLTEKGQLVTCALISGRYRAVQKERKYPGLVTELNYKAKLLGQKARKTTDSLKAGKLKKKARDLKKRAKAANRLCVGGPNSGGSNIPPSPTPRPTTTPSTLCYNSDGSVTSAGKIKFKIPLSMDASLDRGNSFYSNNCTGCHVERRGYSYTAVISAIRADPMNFTTSQVSNQDVADIIAFLNRYTLFCN
ncbi:MAG: cytochrome c [Bdellovibrionales bacterium]|nr:cytochrome c [Bdellovibrionales bacterium]